MLNLNFLEKALGKVCKPQIVDQVYSNTRVLTQVNKSQHESTRVNTSPTQVNMSQQESARVNTSPTRVNTNQHESNTSQHKFDTSQHESTRV